MHAGDHRTSAADRSSPASKDVALTLRLVLRTAFTNGL
jgi:hypothetical protein